MRNLLRNSSLIVLAAWLASACMERTVYHAYQFIPAQGWSKRDTLIFQVPIPDSLKTLKLFAEVRNENSYAYQNLYLVVAHNLQDSTAFRTDTLELTLADKSGKWTGTGWGRLFQSTLPIGTAVTRHSGNYTFRISQGMKDESLVGVRDIGVRVEN